MGVTAFSWTLVITLLLKIASVAGMVLLALPFLIMLLMHRWAKNKGLVFVIPILLSHLLAQAQPLAPSYPPNEPAVTPGWQKAIDENPNLVRRTQEDAFAGGLFQMGLKFLKGKEFSQDYKAAAELFRQAGERGDSRAQYYLAQLYIHGRGVSRDPVEALKWYR